VLADVLTHVQTHFKPNVIIDFATLTGAVIVALGQSTAGIFGNDEELLEAYGETGLRNCEPLWHLPIFKEHRDNVKGSFGDLKQVTGQPYGGASNAAAFLEYFIEKDVKWIHTDIAGPASGWSTDSFVYNKGATGFCVKTAIDFL
jgi:leucyl aminopeptidase